MALNEKTLTRGQVRKLNALRKSLGDKLAEEAFGKWLKQQENKASATDKPDPVAEQIAELLKPIEKKNINLGRYGYAVKRARGKGPKGLVVSRIKTTK